jgi:hypothetical protein
MRPLTLLCVALLALNVVGCSEDDPTTIIPLPHPLEAYDSCTISLQYIGIRSDGGTLPTAGMYFENYGGYWDNNTFTMSWDVSDHGGSNYRGTVLLTIDPETLAVTEFSASSTSLYWTGGPLAIYEISGGDLVIEEFDDNSHIYRVSGEAMCATVTNIYHRHEEDGNISEEFVEYDCDAGSYVQIFFWDKD